MDILQASSASVPTPFSVTQLGEIGLTGTMAGTRTTMLRLLLLSLSHWPTSSTGQLVPTPNRAAVPIAAAAAAAAAPATCITLVGGCDGGGAYDAALQQAIARFVPTLVYGGAGASRNIISTFADGVAIANVTYSCRGGQVPPALTGQTIRDR